MSFATEQLARVEALLSKAAGLKSVSVDGVNISFDDLTAQREHWLAEVEREEGNRRLFVPIDLGG